jgi:NADPH2:quinone reductase
VRAVMSHQAGGPDSLVLEEVELSPVVPDQHVRIAVRACAVNFPDVLMIADRYQVKPPRPFSPGLDIAGTVTSTGAGVNGFLSGMRVMAQVRWGGMAEQIDVAAGRCLEIPDTLPFDEAAAMLTTYGTARHALQDLGQLRRGETVLVLGAAGGVGLAAVELAKGAGARVVAAVSTDAKAEAAIGRGADAVVVYPAGSLDGLESKALLAEVRQACGSPGADVVLDVVGGDYSEVALRAIAPGGRYLVAGFAAGIPRLPMNLVLLKRASIIGVAWSADLDAEPEWLRRQLAGLVEMHKAGRIRPCISTRYPLERAGEAIACVADRRAIGKVIVRMGSA